jgi:hypothetical protein
MVELKKIFASGEFAPKEKSVAVSTMLMVRIVNFCIPRTLVSNRCLVALLTQCARSQELETLSMILIVLMLLSQRPIVSTGDCLLMVGVSVALLTVETCARS